MPNKNMLTNEQLKKMPEIEVIEIINDPNSNEDDYNKAGNFIIDKYTKMIHHHWWVLQRQMENSGYVNAIKEDYYDAAYEALFKAIQKVDTNRIYDKKFKLLQLASWYITNVRTKMIKQIRKEDSKKKSIVTIALDENEDSNTIDSDVEKAYTEKFGYKYNPEYLMELKEGEENCLKGLNECLNSWNSTELSVYNYLKEGKSKTEIANILNVKPTKVYLITKKMSKDLKKALDYDNISYSYN